MEIEGFYRVSGGCLEGVWRVSETCLKRVWKVSGRCVEGLVWTGLAQFALEDIRKCVNVV